MVVVYKSLLSKIVESNRKIKQDIEIQQYNSGLTTETTSELLNILHTTFLFSN